VATPSTAVLVRLLADSSSIWWDDRRTSGRVERRDEILAASLAAAIDALRDRYGDPETGGWRWGRVQRANIHHALRLPALSALGLEVNGGPGTLSPLSGSGTHGASWRMVVELAPELRAWATYPGGQSGNPASGRYRDRLAQWIDGELAPVFLPRSADEVSGARLTSRLRLSRSGR
jgi:penicillin amidase